jgi:hypothetical protein
MNMHVNRPKTGNATIPSGLLQQERDRQTALKTIARLRREAAEEIEKLLNFLDASDQYVTTELENDGDQNDASYPTSGSHCAHPMEDDEEDGTETEPSLASVHDHPNGYYDGTDKSGRRRSQENWAGGNSDDCEGDAVGEDDEESYDREDDRSDHEPSLGWTERGVLGDGQDMELA